jgi:hypothetical protein
MLNLSDAVLKLYGDEGAETLRRFYAQIDYTALWCTRLLCNKEGIQAVLPEAVEDLVVVRNDRVDLHQVKTRDESQGPWKTAEVLPLLCKMYHHRKAFAVGKCEFHFVSDARADTVTMFRLGSSYGALYRLKELLESARQGDFSEEEKKEFEQLQKAILPRVQELMASAHGEAITENIARELLLATWIDTNSQTLRMPNCVVALGMALGTDLAAVEYTTPQLADIHGRLILRIVGKILERSLSDRTIVTEDVLQCRTACNPLEAIDLEKVPGRSVWEKKAYLGGFDPTEMPAFNRLRLGSVATVRERTNLGLETDLHQLTSFLVDQQTICRDEVCRSESRSRAVGPEILRRFRSRLPEVISQFPSLRLTEPDCLGIAWQETDKCVLWWHGLQSSGG